MEFEHIIHEKGLPYKLFLVSIGYRSYHLHAENELIYVLKGSVSLYTPEKEFILIKGDHFFLSAYQVHSLINTSEDNVLLIMQFKSSHDESMSLPHTLDLPSSYLGKLPGNLTVIHPLLTNLLKLYQVSLTSDLSTVYHSYGYYYHILGYLERCFKDHTPSSQTTRYSDDDISRIKQVIAYIEAHHTQKITLQGLANVLHLNRYHLSHFISKKMGINFQAYVNSVRLSHALTLLRDGQLPILQVALSAGFSDHKYLNKMMKTTFGITPKAYQTSLKTLTYDMSQAPDGSQHYAINHDETRRLLRDSIATLS